jgi:predicted ATPase/class 3 adenylate cyclase
VSADFAVTAAPTASGLGPAAPAGPAGDPGDAGDPGATVRALLLTDIVDSVKLAEALGDAAAAALFAAHDRLARDLLPPWRGREIDKTDGMLLLFDAAADALGYALAYQRAMAALAATAPRPLRARAGLHVGPVVLRANEPADVARGAKPLEVDGLAKSVAARVMSVARGGQVLLSSVARDALPQPVPAPLHSHGFWRIKGLAEPLELFEAGDDPAAVAPPPDAEKAWRVVRCGDLWLPVREVRHSLPAERDAFVGRGRELAELAARLESGQRLLSVLGPGGGGKTRLVTRLGWRVLGDFPGGAWFCDLEQARGIDGLAHAMATALDVPLGPGDPVRQLGHALAGRGRCLVVLDNFEQVQRHAGATLGQWLDRAAEASFVVTSRERLGLPGEQALVLDPLPEGDALALLRERARAAGAEPADDEAQPLAELAARLDGLPLAIELAAARLRLLTPAALLARMDERLRLLARPGAARDRQATLRATLDGSWELLAEGERAALAQLSVFEGSFSAEAAEAVLDLQGCDEATWAPDLLHALLDKSLLRREPGGRFRLLAIVQAYAAEHLRTPGRFAGSGPAAQRTAQQRHGAWYAALGPRRAVADRCADLDNLVAACRTAALEPNAKVVVGALQGAWAALRLRGPFAAGVTLARMVVALPLLPPTATARAGAVLAEALDAAGDAPQAAEAAAAALKRATDAGDERFALAVGVHLATLRARQGQADEAQPQLLRTLQRARDLDETTTVKRALNALGTLAFDRSRMDEALQHYGEALALARALGDRRAESWLVGNIGNVHLQRGELDAARARGEQALAILRELGDRHHEATQLCSLGMMAVVQGRLDDAGRDLDQALATARDLGHQRLAAVVQCNLGLVRQAQGQLPQAQQHHAEALALARAAGDRRAAGQFLGYLGLVQAQRGAHGDAAASLAEGEALLRAADDRLGLGVLLCGLARARALAGDAATAARTLAEARALADEAGAGAQSELGQALREAEQALQPGPAGVTRAGSPG